MSAVTTVTISSTSPGLTSARPRLDFGSIARSAPQAFFRTTVSSTLATSSALSLASSRISSSSFSLISVMGSYPPSKSRPMASRLTWSASFSSRFTSTQCSSRRWSLLSRANCLLQLFRLFQDDSGQYLGRRRRLGDLVGQQAVTGAEDEIEDVIERRGQQVNVFAVEGRDEGLVQLDQDAVRHVVAAVLDLLDLLHGSGHLLIVVVVQQVGQDLRTLDHVVRDFREHVEKLGVTRDEAHDRLQAAAGGCREIHDGKY